MEERAELVRLLATVESVPETWNRRARVYGAIMGLRWRINDRQASLDAIAHASAIAGAGRASMVAGIVALVRQHGGSWQGCARDLLALLPDAAPDATRLAKRITEAACDLAAVGVVIERRREAGTGRRVLVLRVAQPAEVEPGGCDAAGHTLVNVDIAEPGGGADPDFLQRYAHAREDVAARVFGAAYGRRHCHV